MRIDISKNICVNTRGKIWISSAEGYKGQQEVTRDYRRLQGAAEG